ncbi:glucose/arabinose dehydrogenase [Advenella incenata]|uniref:Glucose/arabinose dehydrogenase n=2 Tax=Advenella incenata TaxID=267800 RepID=A0A4Q7VDE5_9BURK|nr:PQQ-dependent sugar dehydrogenase [Advenella incenata]RZT93957.1 glucose/arabinose dehydrogenase [Advenella incenata]
MKPAVPATSRLQSLPKSFTHQPARRLLSRSTLASLLMAAVAVSCVQVATAQAQTTIMSPGDKAPVAQNVTTETLLKGLEHPWSMAFLPNDAGMLITERSGHLNYWKQGSDKPVVISGSPKVWANGQGGLLDVVLAPDFAKTRHIYLSYAEEGKDGKAGTAVGFGRLSEDNTKLDTFKVVFRQEPKLSVGNHFGSRIIFDRKGYMFIALGENDQRPTSQDLDKLQGKIVRLFPDGRIPQDNPFVGKQGVRPEIWSYGHRNQQGAALNPWTGALWTNEHGPRGGDEVNIPEPGKNYGWPLATYGINYSGLPIPEAKGTDGAGLTQPIYAWKVSPAISGMAFYDHDRFAPWKQSVFIGALAQQRLLNLKVDGATLKDEQVIFEGERIRDVKVGPDGYVYVLTDTGDGKLIRLGLQN